MKSTLAITAVIFTIGIVTLPVVFSDNDVDWRDYEHRSTGVADVRHPAYTEECGACHMVYPPGLLSTASWTRVMNGLDDHFGDNAELDAPTHRSILQFLTENSADNSKYRRSRKFMKNIDASRAPLRITETAYFKHEHDEIPAGLVSGNERVNSFSHCNACHQQAEQGVFNEHDINIAGYGRWDD